MGRYGEDTVYVLINGWKYQYYPHPVKAKGVLLTPEGEIFHVEVTMGTVTELFNLVLINSEDNIKLKLQTFPEFFGGVQGFKSIYDNNELWGNNVFDPSVVIEVTGPQPPTVNEIKYTITGRVGEKETEVPLEKVEIKYYDYAFTTNDQGVKIPTPEGVERKIYTDVEGKYTIDIILPINGETNEVIPGSKLSLDYPVGNVSYYLDKYSRKNVKCLAGNNTPLQNIPIVLLKPRLQDLKKEKQKYGSVGTKQVKQIKNQVPKDPKAFLIKKIMQMVKKIGDKIIPLLLAMLYEFGMSKIQEGLEAGKNMLEDARCVPNPRLLQMIKLKNKLVRQLNNIYKIIDRAVKFVGIAAGLLSAFRIVIRVLKLLPIPVSFPPGFGIPLSVINKIQDILDKISKKIGQFTQITVGILAALIILREILKQAIKLLDLLDELIGKCAEESGGTLVDESGNIINYSSIPQTELDNALLASLEEEENDGNPGPPYLVNGFILEVQTDRKNPVGSLKRRYAVAKNKQGIIMLEGEKSFSANDQILINELKFYIQQNDLKAF